MTKTSLGPNGNFPLLTPAMKKMVINHLEKVFVTSDTATMLREVKSEILKTRWKFSIQPPN